MKKSVIVICLGFGYLFGSAMITSCENGNEAGDETESHEHHDHDQDAMEEKQDHDEDHEHAAVFQCPMKCEGDKTYAEAGSCPSCGMDLEELAHSHEEDNDHDHESDHDHDGGT